MTIHSYFFNQMTSPFETDDLFFTEVVKGRQTKHGGTNKTGTNNNASSYNRRHYDTLISDCERNHNYGFNCNQQGKTLRHFNGFRLEITKGSVEERNLFSLKDSVQRGGLTYYFENEDDMKRSFYGNIF
jgi:hypothetical protein